MFDAPSGFRLPHDVAIEREILGTVLLGDVILPDLVVDDFANLENRECWRQVQSVASTGATPDAIAVGSLFVESATFASPADAWQYIADLASGCTGLKSQIPHHAARLRELACRRRQIEIADRLRAAATSGDDTSAIVTELATAAGRGGGDLPLTWWADIDGAAPPNMLVDGLLEAGTLSVVFGAPKSGKTFFVTDVGLRVAMGWPWRGRIVKRGMVAYIAGEGAAGIGKRLTAFVSHFVDADPASPFLVIPRAVDMTDMSAVSSLVRTLSAAAKQCGYGPAFITIDTMARCMTGDENSVQDVSAFIAGCDRLREQTGAHVCIVHHAGKQSGNGPRGSTALLGAVDTCIEVTKGDGGSVATITAQRNLEAGETFGFELHSVETAAGSSCVVIEASDVGSTRERITGAARIALDALCRAVEECGYIPPTNRNIPERVHVVQIDVWRRHFDMLHIDAVNTVHAKRMAFKRAADRLQAIGIVGVCDKLVWKVNK